MPEYQAVLEEELRSERSYSKDMHRMANQWADACGHAVRRAQAWERDARRNAARSRRRGWLLLISAGVNLLALALAAATFAPYIKELLGRWVA